VHDGEARGLRPGGGFDEALAVAYNDVDFCLRVRQQGLRVVYTPFAQLKHEESSSRGALDPSADHDVFRARWAARPPSRIPSSIRMCGGRGRAAAPPGRLGEPALDVDDGVDGALGVEEVEVTRRATGGGQGHDGQVGGVLPEPTLRSLALGSATSAG